MEIILTDGSRTFVVKTANAATTAEDSDDCVWLRSPGRTGMWTHDDGGNLIRVAFEQARPPVGQAGRE